MASVWGYDGPSPDARATLSQRRTVLDDVETITACAQDMSEFLNESEMTERRAFVETFVKEVVVMPGNALLRYTRLEVMPRERLS